MCIDVDEYEKESKRRISLVYPRISIIHRYFSQNWVDEILNVAWERKRLIVDDIFEDTEKIAKRAIKEGLIVSSKLKGENNIEFPHPLAFMLKDLGCILESLKIPISNQQIKSYLDFHEIRIKVRKSIMEKYEGEVSQEKYLGFLLYFLNVENQLFSTGLLLKVVEILNSLETKENFVPKAQKYANELMNCDYEKFFSNLCEILVVGSFLKKNVLLEIEGITPKGKKPDLLIVINEDKKIELEVYAPGRVQKIERGATELFEDEIYRTPFMLDEKDTFEKIRRKLDRSQLSGQFPGILVIESTFSQTGPDQFSDAFLSIIQSINTNSLSSHPFINHIPEELSGFILIDRRKGVKAHYYPIPNAKNKIEESVLKLLIGILNK